MLNTTLTKLPTHLSLVRLTHTHTDLSKHKATKAKRDEHFSFTSHMNPSHVDSIGGITVFTSNSPSALSKASSDYLSTKLAFNTSYQKQQLHNISHLGTLTQDQPKYEFSKTMSSVGVGLGLGIGLGIGSLEALKKKDSGASSKPVRFIAKDQAEPSPHILDDKSPRSIPLVPSLLNRPPLYLRPYTTSTLNHDISVSSKLLFPLSGSGQPEVIPESTTVTLTEAASTTPSDPTDAVIEEKNKLFRDKITKAIKSLLAIAPTGGLSHIQSKTLNKVLNQIDQYVDITNKANWNKDTHLFVFETLFQLQPLVELPLIKQAGLGSKEVHIGGRIQSLWRSLEPIGKKEDPQIAGSIYKHFAFSSIFIESKMGLCSLILQETKHVETAAYASRRNWESCGQTESDPEVSAFVKQTEARLEALNLLLDKHYTFLIAELKSSSSKSSRLPFLPSLLRLAADTEDVSSALLIFRAIEDNSQTGQVPVICYPALIKMFAKQSDATSITDIWRTYVQGRKMGVLSPQKDGRDNLLYDQHVCKTTLNAYFTAGQPDLAVALLDEVIRLTTVTPKESDEALYISKIDTELVTPVIVGFLERGDFTSALRWFDKTKELIDTIPDRSFEPLLSAVLQTQPKSNGQETKLVKNLWSALKLGQKGGNIFSILRFLLASGYKATGEENAEIIDWILKLLNEAREPSFGIPRLKTGKQMKGDQYTMFFNRLLRLMIASNERERAMKLYIRNFDSLVPTSGSNVPKNVASGLMEGARILLMTEQSNPVPFEEVVGLVSLIQDRLFSATQATEEFKSNLEFYLISRYLTFKQLGTIPTLDEAGWLAVIRAGLTVLLGSKTNPNLPVGYPGIEPLIDDFEISEVGPLETSRPQELVDSFIKTGLEARRIRTMVSILNPAWKDLVDVDQAPADALEAESVVSNQGSTTPTFTDAQTEITEPIAHSLQQSVYTPELGETFRAPDYSLSLEIDPKFSASIQYAASTVKTGEPNERLVKALNSAIYNVRFGKAAHPEVLANLAEALGRASQMEMARQCYTIAYEALQSIPWTQRHASACALENAMIIAFANSGDLQFLPFHRQRLLELQSAPNADAYAAMILNMHDTTDDASVAVELFNESRNNNVKPNAYLFNTLISKLSRARRRLDVLHYFEMMKEEKIAPTAVTYGSVINACCKTGDGVTASILFVEMTRSEGFKPRAPPYNTMIQFHTTVAPDRRMALHYFNQMSAAGVKPTSHTYKLLLDAYGTIQSPDMINMNLTFERLQADPRVAVTGMHWASLITAHGTINKNLGEAEKVFSIIKDESIKHRNGRENREDPLPDAVVYEAMLNACLVNNRPDLCEIYAQKMKDDGVKSTAYIANTLIKAKAQAGNLEGARQLFESMADPAPGHAAPGNHLVNRHPTHKNQPTAPLGVVYREPSTWSTMLSVELDAGEEERARDLVRRVDERGFPDAVLAGIKRLFSSRGLDA